MLVYYITGSQIPSINANTIQVLSMCSAVSNQVKNVKFFFYSKISNLNKIKIKNIYDIELKANVNLCYLKLNKFFELFIFIYSFFNFAKDTLINKKPQVIICRNIYAAYFFSFFIKKIVYETHTVEKIKIRSYLQKKILLKDKMLCVVITNALKEKIKNKYKKILANIIVLPDCSIDNFNLLKKNKNKKKLKKNKNKIISYFGHLYKGRGIEQIINISKILTQYDFYIIGGDSKNLNFFRNKVLNKNVFFLGYQNFSDIKFLIDKSDILLCPYQKNVFLKDQKTSTVSIMSPLKIFEYMSSNKPIISSNLNVLKEILKNNINCIMVNPVNLIEWKNAILKIFKDQKFSNQISLNAYNNFKSNYTWDKRVKKILNNL